MVGLYLLFMYGVGVTVLGLIVLKYVPPLRLTFGNLWVFVMGAFTGMAALANIVLRGLFYLGIRMNSKDDVLVYPVALVGATLGGGGLVWLKMRLAKKSGKAQP